MSGWAWCIDCRSAHAEGKHDPEWEVWRAEEDGGREWASTIRSKDPQEAAERWAEELESDGDYAIACGGDELVFVAAPGDTPAKYIVTGELVAEYMARAVGDDE